MKNNKSKLLCITLIVLIASILITGCTRNTNTGQGDAPAGNPALEAEDERAAGKDGNEEVVGDEDVEPANELSDEEFSLTMSADNFFIYSIQPAKGTVYQTGMPYAVDRQNESGEWENVDLDMAFTMQIVIVDSQNPFFQDIDLTEMKPGTYRVSKSILSEAGEPIEDLGVMKVVVLDPTK